MKKEFLPIGTMVQVFKEAYVAYTKYGEKSKKTIFTESLPNITIGVIVGGTYLCEGEGHYGRSSGFNGEYDPSYLSVSKKIFVYLVRKGFTNKAMKVLPEDLHSLTVGIVSQPKYIPFFYSKQPLFTDKNRLLLRHIMSTIPRDAKGRWLK